MRVLAHLILCVVSAAYAASVLAAPVTFDVVPTFAAPAGIVDGYRAYQACDLATQAKGALIAPAVSGQPFSFQGDSAQTYTVCVVAFNTSGEGGFLTVGNIAATLNPPGDTSTTYVCSLSPTEGGSCVVSP